MFKKARQPHFLDQLSQEEILDLRICDLQLNLKKSWISPLIKDLYRELKSKGLHFKPHVWISDDWFSPDGQAGFAIPFFILHPKLIKLEREAKGYVEGCNANWAMKLIRHETGHAIDNAFRLRALKKRQSIFGKTSTPYPDNYEINPYSKKYVRHLSGHYAQAHPDEDWAETFALWLTPKSNWKEKYQGWGALAKLNYLNQVMKDLRFTSQKNINQREIDCWNKDTRTLREFFKARAKSRIKKEKFLQKELGPVISSRKRIPAYAFLRAQRSLLKRELGVQLKVPQYKINTFLSDLMLTTKKNDLYFSKSEKEILQTLSKSAKSYINKGNHKVLM
tara:strand:- start:68460 stop:69464 length:1005 start_codon:yes stop_codon:yes gene_type:complete